MASSLRKNLEDQVTCAICHEHYRDPRLLPCLHTYCKQCLDDLVRASPNKGQIACPECREVVKIGSGGTNQFKVHFQMNNLMSLLTISTPEEDARKPELLCENCTGKDAAKGRCVDCCKFMCEFCWNTHQRFQDTHDHKIITLEQVKKQGVPAMTQQVKCDKHKGEVKKLFCESCQQLICRDCTIVDHRDHKFQFIDEVAGKHVNKLKSDIQKGVAAKGRVQTSLDAIKKAKTSIKTTADKTKNDIDVAIIKKIQILEQQQVRLKKEVDTITNNKIQKLDKQESGHTTKLACLKSAIEFAENTLQSKDNVNILSVSPQASSRLTSLVKAQFRNKPCEVDTLFFQENGQSFQEIVTPLMQVFAEKPKTPPPDHGLYTNYYQPPGELVEPHTLDWGIQVPFGQEPRTYQYPYQ